MPLGSWTGSAKVPHAIMRLCPMRLCPMRLCPMRLCPTRLCDYAQCPVPRLRDNIGTQRNLILDVPQADFWDSSGTDGAAGSAASGAGGRNPTVGCGAPALGRITIGAADMLQSGSFVAMTCQRVSGKALWPSVVAARLASIPGAILARLAHIVLEQLPGFGA